MKLRALTLVVAVAGMSAVTVSAQPISAGTGFAVVELFTSEGCSSCPPADEALSRLSAQAAASNLPVYALEWHVDYWDYLGWKDPFGSRLASQRQYDYARALPSSVYTPQVVMNGALVPSWAGDLAELQRDAELLAATPARAALHLQVLPTAAPGALSVTARAEGAPRGAQVLIVLVEDDLGARPTAGENAGRDLHHSGVVRSAALVPGSGGQVSLTIPRGTDLAHAAVIGLVQDSRTMKIFAADRAPVTDGTTARISGRVTDGGGHGVEGVTVQACSGSVCVPATTGSDGAFDVPGLKPGTWSLTAGAHTRAVRVELGPGEAKALAEPIVLSAP